MTAPGGGDGPDDGDAGLQETIARLERALRRERTARRMAEDIAEDATRRLYDSLRQLEQEHEALRSLAAAATHDLKNPLAAIRGFADLLLEPDVGADTKALMTQRLASTAAYTETLFDGLLEAIEAGAGHGGIEEVDLDALVSAVAAGLAARHPHASLTAEGALGVVLADPTAVRRVLDNLVENAARHAGVERVEVTIAVHAELSREVELRIADNGTGIAASDADRIFRLFVRGEQQQPGTGRGVGLAVSRGLARANGGQLVLSPEPGPAGGAAFLLRLPRPSR